MVRLAHCNIHTIHDDESAKCLDNIKSHQFEIECLCGKTTTDLTTVPETMDVSLTFLLHYK